MMVMVKSSASKAGLSLKGSCNVMVFSSCTIVVNLYLTCFHSREETTGSPNGCSQCFFQIVSLLKKSI